MSTEQVIAFWQRAQVDTQLLEATRSGGSGAASPDLNALCTIAANAGFECTPEEFDAVENVVRFWDWANAGDRIQERLKSAQARNSYDETLSAIVQIAAEAGFTFTTDQLDVVTRVLFEAASGQGAELSDKDLEHVAGGVGQTPAPYRQSFSQALNGGWGSGAGGRPFQAISF